jgi:nicotinate-nucleotide adenylyltransferase
MKKIGILGGTFDPPHFGHLIMANEVASQLNLDSVWFLPNQVPPHKVKTSSTTTVERLQMLEKATENNPLFRIETMAILKKEYPEHEFYFIIGADMIEYLPKWYKINELVQLVHFVGVKRPGFSTESIFPIIYVDAPLIDISSKMIRNRITNKETIRYLLPESVRIYIKENHLYGSK